MHPVLAYPVPRGAATAVWLAAGAWPLADLHVGTHERKREQPARPVAAARDRPGVHFLAR
jgi:hypothetical protein